MKPVTTSFLSQRIRSVDYVGRDVKRQRCEQAKAAWAAVNPEATPAEYQAAIHRISQECGV